MIAIIDYGVGNLFSLKSSLGMVGAQATVSGDAQVLAQAETQGRALPRRGWTRSSAGRLRAASASWASAWACSCSSSAAMNTASTPAWG